MNYNRITLSKAALIKVIQACFDKNETNLFWGIIFIDKSPYHLVRLYKDGGPQEHGDLYVCSQLDYDKWCKCKEEISNGSNLKSLDREHLSRIWSKIEAHCGD